MSDFKYYTNKNDILEKMPIELRPPFNYWDELASVSAMAIPEKSSFSPAKVKKSLPWLALFKIDENNTISVRLAGTGISHLYGNIANSELEESELQSAPKNNVREIIARCIENAAPVYQEAFQLKCFEDNLKDLALLSLPFSSDGTHIDHVLLVVHSDITEAMDLPLI